MSNLRQAAQQALEALQFYYDLHGDEPDAKAILALRAALAEPEQEPAPGYCKHCKQYTIEEPLPAEPQTTHWEGCEAVHPECRKPEPVLVSPTTFIQTVLYKEDTVGRPTIWTQWPNEEKNT